MAESTSTPPRRLPRPTVRALMLLVAAAGLAMGLSLFWRANRDPEHAWISLQLRTLADPDASTSARLAAAEALDRARGRQGRRAVRVLATALDDPEPEVRRTAATVLGLLGEGLRMASKGGEEASRRQAALALIRRLDDPADEVRDQAASSLAGLVEAARFDGLEILTPEEAGAAVIRLLALIGDSEDPLAWLYYHQWAVNLLIGDGPAGLRFRYDLAANDDRPAVRRGAILTLRGLRNVTAAERIGFLVDLLPEAPADDRPAIALTIMYIQHDDPSLQPLPAELLDRIAVAVVDEFGEGTPASRKAADEARGDLIEALLGSRPDPAAVLPRLVEAARAEVDRGADPHACWAVLVIGVDTPEADDLRARLVAALADEGRPDPWRQRVADTLRAHLNRAPVFGDPLRPGLIAAAEAEARGDHEPIAAALLLALDSDPGPDEVRSLAVALLESLDRPMPEPRRASLLSLLWTLADGAPDLRPALEAYRDHDSPRVAEGAEIMLDRLGEEER